MVLTIVPLYVKIFSEATLVFPLLVAETFAKNFPHTRKVPTQSN